jgi:hypothetical protein
MTQQNEALRKTQTDLLAQSTQLYEQFGKPLEAEHHGQYVAISSDGRTLLGKSASEVGRRAREAFGPGNFVFKLGPRVVGRWL